MLIITTIGGYETATAEAIADYLAGEETIAEYANARGIVGAATVMVDLPDYADGEYAAELADVFSTFPTVTRIRTRTGKAISA